MYVNIMSKTNKKVINMNNEAIKDFYNIIYMLDTILCALKWQRLQNNNIFVCDAEIAVFDLALTRLKECCVNNIGCPDE